MSPTRDRRLEDPNVVRQAGCAIPVAELAEEYGFTDIEQAEDSAEVRGEPA